MRHKFVLVLLLTWVAPSEFSDSPSSGIHVPGTCVGPSAPWAAPIVLRAVLRRASRVNPAFQSCYQREALRCLPVSSPSPQYPAQAPRTSCREAPPVLMWKMHPYPGRSYLDTTSYRHPALDPRFQRRMDFPRERQSSGRRAARLVAVVKPTLAHLDESHERVRWPAFSACPFLHSCSSRLLDPA